MERAAGFAHDDTAQARLDKLDTLLAQSSTSADDTALLAEMLSLPNDGQRTLEALLAQPEALSRSNPVLMILKDLSLYSSRQVGSG
jgi:hypothetical protein